MHCNNMYYNTMYHNEELYQEYMEFINLHYLFPDYYQKLVNTASVAFKAFLLQCSSDGKLDTFFLVW